MLLINNDDKLNTNTTTNNDNYDSGRRTKECVLVGTLYRTLVKSELRFNFLVPQPKHNMLWVLTRAVSMECSFDHQKHMLKLMGKKILIFYTEKFSLSKPVYSRENFLA